MAWPDTTPLSRTNLDADADTVTGVDGGRDQIDKAVQRLNSLLNASTQGSVLYTSTNPQPYQPISGVSQNEIVVGSATGTPAGSNKTISTSVGADDSTVPTGKAVQTYVGQNSGASDVTMYIGGVNSNGSAINLPTGWTSSVNSGVYTVDTNGLNVFSARIVITPRSTLARFVTCDVPSPFTSFTFRVYDSSGVISSSTVGFHLALSTY